MGWKEATLYTGDTQGTIIARVQFDRVRCVLEVTHLFSPDRLQVGARVNFWEPGTGHSAPLFRATITRLLDEGAGGEGAMYEFEEM